MFAKQVNTIFIICQNYGNYFKYYNSMFQLGVGALAHGEGIVLGGLSALLEFWLGLSRLQSRLFRLLRRHSLLETWSSRWVGTLGQLSGAWFVTTSKQWWSTPQSPNAQPSDAAVSSSEAPESGEMGDPWGGAAIMKDGDPQGKEGETSNIHTHSRNEQISGSQHALLLTIKESKCLN